MDLHGPLQGMVLLCYMWMILVPQRKYIYETSRPVTGIALFIYM
jgi:hypothetical protein